MSYRGSLETFAANARMPGERRWVGFFPSREDAIIESLVLANYGGIGVFRGPPRGGGRVSWGNGMEVEQG